MRIPRQRFPPAPRRSPRFTLTKAAVALAAVVAAGTFGIMLVEGWGFVHSLFFTIITLTTVGYADYGLSEGGKLVALGLMVGGLAVVTYSAGQLVPTLFNQNLVWERKMNQRILSLENHFIVCGLGRIGRSVCRHLAREGMPFVGIDPDTEAVVPLVEADQLVLLGDATEDELLMEAGIERAKAIACVAGSDSNNLAITLAAREMNPGILIVSRAERADAIRRLQRAGANRVIAPIRTGGSSIVDAILKPNLANFIDLVHDRTEDFELEEITVEAGSALDGSTIRIQGTAHRRLLVIALKRPESEALTLRPDPDEPLRGNDLLIVAGDMHSIDQLRGQAVGSMAA